jgi:hypothetical protein
VRIASTSRCTHSYNVQPLLDYTGQLRGKLYVCLQETGGKMGPAVKASYYRAPNVSVTCSASGKLTSSLFERWVEKVYGKVADEPNLLLLDSWTGQQDDANFAAMLEDVNPCQRLQIPPKTTPLVQPLDVYYFRQWKLAVKACYNRVLVDNLAVNLGTRDNVLRLQSLIHNQFSAPAFTKMGQYAWFSAGLSTTDPRPFQNAQEILFSGTAQRCGIGGCGHDCFITCAWCRARLCFEHFFPDHTHFDGLQYDDSDNN